MSVSSTSSTSSATSSSLTSSASTGMGTSDFLTILITQLQNQDPLSPTDTDAMVTELCALTQVETLNNIQTQLSSLSGMGQWASTIGDYMQVSDPTVSKGDVVVLVPGRTNYDHITLTLKNSDGGTETVTLTSDESTTYEVPGSYTISSATYTTGTKSTTCPYAVYRKVAGVEPDKSGTGVLLVAGDGTTYATTNISAITTKEALTDSN